LQESVFRKIVNASLLRGFCRSGVRLPEIGKIRGHDVSNENGRLIKQLFERNTVVIVFRNTCLWKSYSHHGTGKVTFGKRFGKRTRSQARPFLLTLLQIANSVAGGRAWNFSRSGIGQRGSVVEEKAHELFEGKTGGHRPVFRCAPGARSYIVDAGEKSGRAGRGLASAPL
jgi:hypothetical protein